MINAYSQRLMPPFSGQVQIAESERARVLTMDGEVWEIHFQYAASSYRRVAYIEHKELVEIPQRTAQELSDVDERIIELAGFVTESELPYPAADRFEYWLLDRKDGSPLALIFSCTSAEEMETYPSRPEWTALPAAVLPIEATPEEKDRSVSPVNYRVESLVSKRAGTNPVARWFERHDDETENFPPFMIREDWEDPADEVLCQRYIERQSTRLLMLHGLEHEVRLRLEGYARAYALEVDRFFHLYPEVADNKQMSAILIEARLRRATGDEP
jgi:hypothetical protein